MGFNKVFDLFKTDPQSRIFSDTRTGDGRF